MSEDAPSNNKIYFDGAYWGDRVDPGELSTVDLAILASLQYGYSEPFRKTRNLPPSKNGLAQDGSEYEGKFDVNSYEEGELMGLIVYNLAAKEPQGAIIQDVLLKMNKHGRFEKNQPISNGVIVYLTKEQAVRVGEWIEINDGIKQESIRVEPEVGGDY